jgi:hypothetical protein
MKFLNVREYTSVEISKVVTDVNMNKITIPAGEKLYFVNNVFSRPHSGFLMTADGVPLSATTDSSLTPDEMVKLAAMASKNVKSGKFEKLCIRM